MKELIESGKIVNTHGIRGEVRIQPWCDTPEFLAGFKTLYIDGEPRAAASRVHNAMVLCKLEGADSVDEAAALVGKTVGISRADAKLPEGKFFISDLIGLDAVSEGKVFGKITDVLTPPAHDVYEVKGEKTYLIPAVKEFVLDISLSGGYIEFKLIEGFEQ